MDDSDKISRTLEISTENKELIKVLCLTCHASTNHKILASAYATESFDDGQNNMSGWIDNQIIECQGCNTVSYRTTAKHSEDWDHDQYGNMEYNEKETLYPSREGGRTAIIDSYMLSTDLRRIYDEVIKAMNNDQPVLAGIGIRALVETVCKDKKATEGNLKDKIDMLVTLGVLTPAGATILHQIRTLGNDAAHEVKPHTPAQLAIALTVCEHLFEGVYVLPSHAKKMLPQLVEKQK